MRRSIIPFFYLILIPASFHSSLLPQEDWKLRKSENGISVYTRHQEGRSVDELKVESDVQAPLSTVVAVIKDAVNYKDWIYRCSESRLLKKISDFEQYEYQVNVLPFPLSNRDIVTHFTMSQDSSTRIVTTRSVGVPNYIPPVEGLVRIPLFDGGYTLIPKSNGVIHMVYSLQVEPGGHVPDWLVNMSIVAGPYESTFNLKNKIREAVNNHVSDPNIKD